MCARLGDGGLCGCLRGAGVAWLYSVWLVVSTVSVVLLVTCVCLSMLVLAMVWLYA